MSDQFMELDHDSSTFIFNSNYLFSKNQLKFLDDKATINYSDILWICNSDSRSDLATIISKVGHKIIKKVKIPFLFFKKTRNLKILEIFTEDKHFQIKDHSNGEWGRFTINKKKKQGTLGYNQMIEFLKSHCRNAIFSQGYSEEAENKYRAKIGLPKLQKSYYENSTKNNKDL